MNSKLPEKIDLISIQGYIDTRGLRKQLVDQIEKDLGGLQVSASLEDATFFSCIFKIISQHIEQTIENQPDRIAQLLYVIDVPEVKVKEQLATNGIDSARIIAELILEKETQKVFIRNVYNGSITL